MKITKAEYMTSCVDVSHYPSESLPEMMVTGRSNVGKSSFINSLTHRKALARTSSRPGKTQTLNFYNISDVFHLVDVPGYGYAKVSKPLKEEFGRMIEQYMATRETLILGVVLVDFRHEPSKEDVAMYELYAHYEIPTLVIATKKDKVKRSQHSKHERVIRDKLGLNPDAVLIPYSSETHEARDEVWEILDDLIAQYGELVD